MKIWKQPFDLELLNNLAKDTLLSHVGIVFTTFGENSLTATMPVDKRTIQPMGLLHGGASVVLAETLGSVASMLCLEDIKKQAAVGLEINANHIRSATKGQVTGVVTPIKIGRSVHVWRIEIYREDKKQVCESRITISVVDRA